MIFLLVISYNLYDIFVGDLVQLRWYLCWWSCTTWMISLLVILYNLDVFFVGGLVQLGWYLHLTAVVWGNLENIRYFFSSSVISSDCQHCVLNSLSNRTLSRDPRLASPLPSYGSSKLHYSFQNSLLAAVAAAALCLIVYYCHENHLCHPHLGAPPKWDSCTTKMGQDHPSRHYK